MRKKSESLNQNLSSLETTEASLDYKYFKILNNELSKEVAELRKDQTRKQLDIDHLLSEKFNIELKYNKLCHLFSNIEERSRITLNHIVECSNELAYIMQITSKVKSLNSKLSDTPLSKSRENSFKQVVTPHAVNGHIIHTPTIRIARYSQSTSESDPNCAVNDPVDQNSENDNSSIDEEINENDEVINEEDQGNGTFNSMSTICPLINSEISSLDEDIEEPIGEDPPVETNEQLSTIQEELEESVDEETDQPVFSSKFQEVNMYLNQTSEKASRVNNKRGSNNSTSDFCDSDTSISSVVAEASTSYNSASKYNDDETTYPEGNVSKRKSLIERKSIGSPIPLKTLRVSRRSKGYKRRSSELKSLSSTSGTSSNTPRNSQEFRRSITSPHSDTSGTSESTLRNSSFKASNSQIDTTQNDSSSCDTVVSKSLFVPTIESFIEKTSLHSTPSMGSSFHTSSLSDAQTPVMNKVNFRKNRLKKPAIPVVHLIRLTEEYMEHKGIRLKKSTIDRKRSREERLSDEKPIKREKSDAPTRDVQSKSRSPSSPKKSPLSDNERGRPKRNARPISLKEPSLTVKMRRPR